MNLSPFIANFGELRRDRGADLGDFSHPKPGLFDQVHGTSRAIQFNLGQCPITPDGVDMRRRMIVGIDRYANASDR
jgi:hypothetical protein